MVSRNPYGQGQQTTGLIIRMLSAPLCFLVHMLCRWIPFPIFVIALLQIAWIAFDQNVTSQIYHPPPRKYHPPTDESPLSPFYGADYAKANIPTRIFSKKEFPCNRLITEKEFQSPKSVLDEGFFFQMQPYSGSTTLAGIAGRMARNVARRRHFITQPNETACAAWVASLRARRLRDIDRMKSFLWSVMREPVDRFVSRFFHTEVSKNGKAPTIENFEQFARDTAFSESGASIRLLTMRRYVNIQRRDLLQNYVREILNYYDFVGVLERLHESLAVLQLLLGLETEDMLYLTSRSGSRATDGASYAYHVSPPSKASGNVETKTCTKIQPTQVTLPMKELLHQPYMYEEVFEADILLYNAINASLDATIQSIGRERVDAAASRIAWAQHRVEARCASNTIFPCSKEGVVQSTKDCFFGDIGCGSNCMDAIGKNLTSDHEFLQIS